MNNSRSCSSFIHCICNQKYDHIIKEKKCMVLIVVIKIVTFCLEVVVRRVSNKDSVFKLTSFYKEKVNYQLATGKSLLNIYRSYQRCSVKEDVLQTFVNFTEKLLCWNLFLIKLIIKKRLQHRCFPEKTTTFLRAPILKYIYERLLL